MPQVASALYDIGCRTFFVAYLHEGIELRKLLGADPRIFVFNGIQPDEAELFFEHDLIPVCNSISQVEFCVSNKYSKTYSIHFDTGMNRLGIRRENWERVISHAKTKAPELILSHLACGDIADHPMNVSQLKQFESLVEFFPDSQKSFANTAGTYLGPEYHFDLIRPGIGLYGGGPPRPPEIRLKAALTLTAPVLNSFAVEAGDSVGYGATHVFKKPAILATVALGYADGFLRAASNYGFGVIDGIPCPIVGRISMDLITIDVSDMPEPPKTGDRVEFIGPSAGYEIQAETMGTIGYELTSRLGGRISRSWTY